MNYKITGRVIQICDVKLIVISENDLLRLNYKSIRYEEEKANISYISYCIWRG